MKLRFLTTNPSPESPVPVAVSHIRWSQLPANGYYVEILVTSGADCVSFFAAAFHTNLVTRLISLLAPPVSNLRWCRWCFCHIPLKGKHQSLPNMSQTTCHKQLNMCLYIYIYKHLNSNPNTWIAAMYMYNIYIYMIQSSVSKNVYKYLQCRHANNNKKHIISIQQLHHELFQPSSVETRWQT